MATNITILDDRDKKELQDQIDEIKESGVPGTGGGDVDVDAVVEATLEELAPVVLAMESATTNANKATTSANTAALNADTKAGLADTAAVNANNAASSANQAATLADNMARGAAEAVEEVITAKNNGEFDGKDGTNGVSPTITTSEITGGHRLTIKDVNGTKTVDVMDGKDGKDGTGGSGETSEVSIPSYWETAIVNAIGKVKNIQNMAGKDVVNFIHFSDMHYTSGGTNYTNNIGIIAKRLMYELGIPFIVGTGDITRSATATSSELIDADVNDAVATIAPVGLENFLYCKGNHDGGWGPKATYGVNYAMIQHPNKLWNRLYRWQAEDFRRVFSDDGSYYYVDNLPQKVRYIVLNSHWADYSGITDMDYDAQATEYNTQKNINYGDAQAEWLATKALNFDEDDGWTVVVFTHAPLWSKFNGTAKNYLSVQYAGTNNASTIRNILIGFYNKSASVTYKSGSMVNFSNVGDSTIAGVFCGHCHTDLMVKRDEAGTGTDIPFPIVSITSAGHVNSSYEEGFGMPITTRTNGTNKETAFDIVSINKNTKMIYTTRIGAGNDRTTFYGESSVEEVTLTSITVVYTGSSVTVGTPLTDLTGITVTGSYSDGSTAPVTDYTLSGEITIVGNNTITVSYGGFTATFVVVGLEAVIPIPDVVLNTNVFDKTADGFIDNTRISSSASANGYLTTATNQFATNYIRIDSGMYINIDVPGMATQISTTIGGYYLAYDLDKNRVGTYFSTSSGTLSDNKYRIYIDTLNVAYVRFTPYKTTGSGITVDNCNIVITTS